jgi:anti-anti-sigma regulatory factor/anti-sigma regulatory factor (Ser/Thr protein kinase)
MPSTTIDSDFATKATRIPLGRSLTGANLDEALAPRRPGVNAILLDLQDVVFADPSAFVYLAAIMKTLASRGVELRIELPTEPRVRDIMRRYRFGAVVGELLNANPLDVLTPHSLQAYSGAPVTHYAASIRRGGLDHRVTDRLARMQVLDGVNLRAAMSVIDGWDAPEIKAFLEVHLGSNARMVAPGIIYEALANAVRHPKATAVTTVAYATVGEKDPSKRHLTVAFWDDGDSIMHTLRKALKRGYELRTDGFDPYYNWYGVESAIDHVQIKGELYRVNSGHSIRRTDGAPDDISDADLLIAATFPGITSDPDGLREVAPGAHGEKYDNRPGMGLYILTSLAMEDFGGSVLIRSGGVAANFRRATEKEEREHNFHYRVGVIENDAMARHFSGNLVVVRLPLRSQL